MTPRLLAFGVLLASASGCAARAPSSVVAPATAPVQGQTAIPPIRGPLHLTVVYPTPNSVVDAADSTFVFGSAGTGDARVTVSGQPVVVAANGAWLAWVALPAGAAYSIDVVARTGTDSARVSVPVLRPPKFTPPLSGPWIDTLSIMPRGRLWVARNEEVELSVHAAVGATLRLRLADGTIVPLVAAPSRDAIPDGIRNFDRDAANLRRVVRPDRFAGILRGRSVGAPLGIPLGVPLQSSGAGGSQASPLLEAIVGRDTVRVRWPLQITLLDTLPTVVELDDDIAHTGRTDSITIGRALPGGSYHWFFPTGTRATVKSVRDSDVELSLGDGSTAWVAATEVRPLPAGTPRPRAVVSSLSITSGPTTASLRIPMTQRIPYQIEETAGGLRVVLYGASGDVDWMRYNSTDSLIRVINWQQRGTGDMIVDLTLAQPVWGWRARFDGTDLLIDVRRPPHINASAPLKALRIALDPGHPPGGGTGPTGLREAEANLSIVRALAPMLEAEGATVLWTRTVDTAVALGDRVPLAERLNADLIISIHNNAFPDGLNPFTNNGTSTFYGHLPSLPLAAAVQRALVASIGIRDLGVSRGDLALVRGTWMPSIMCEGMFMMVPEQEAALRSLAGQRRYAAGVVNGLREWLTTVAASSTAGAH